MNKDRFMDVTGDNFTIDKRPQKFVKDDGDQTASQSLAQLRPYANRDSLRQNKRSESADFSDNTITPNDGYSVDNNLDSRDQQSYLQTIGQRINQAESPHGGYANEDAQETLSKNEGSTDQKRYNAVKGGLLPPIIGQDF